MSWLHEATTDFLKDVDEIKRQHAFPFFRRFENIGPRVKIARQSYINFTSNDYLGLSQDRRLIGGATAALERYGTGLGSSRLQATSDRHEVLEHRLARWLRYPACAVFTTGYQAMVGLLSTFVDNDTTLAIDKLSHACIVDGAFLAQGTAPDAEIRSFKHNNAKSLRRVLSQSDKKKKLVVVEGLYSVDGDLAPLPELIEVCREFDAPIVVDDAHGLGTIGKTGRGVGEIHNVLDQIDVLVGTFSKSFGGVGGFVLSDHPIIDFLKLRAKAFVYSASLPVAQVEAATAALEIIESDHSYFRRLEDNRDFFRRGLLELGFDLGESETHITPIMVGDEEKTLKFGAYLYHGAQVLMMPFIYPGVPHGKARLRCNVTAAHSQADMGYTLEALAVIGKELGLIDDTARTTAGKATKAWWTAQGKVSAARNAGWAYLAGQLGDVRGKVGRWTKEMLR